MKEIQRRELKRIWNQKRIAVFSDTHLRIDLYVLLYLACFFWRQKKWAGIYVERNGQNRWRGRERGAWYQSDIHYWSEVYKGPDGNWKMKYRAYDDFD